MFREISFFFWFLKIILKYKNHSYFFEYTKTGRDEFGPRAIVYWSLK